MEGCRSRVGVTDWNLKLTANPDSVPLAARLGFDGVQMSFGQKLIDGRMPADDPAVIARYLKLSAENRIPIDAQLTGGGTQLAGGGAEQTGGSSGGDE